MGDDHLDDKVRIRVFSLACFAVAELVLFFPPLLEALSPTNFWGPMAVFLAVFSLLAALFPSPPAEKERRVFCKDELKRLAGAGRVTSIACRGGCGVVYSRLLVRGDCYGKMIGKCPGCGGELYVRSIWKVPARMV
jgi:hypothetical protein